ncbi:hypothetical protein LTR17_026101 [Elasticomyces elasticus]|nr:hypothetical protein LTR17_026101 [Elasticomyces elasticus]
MAKYGAAAFDAAQNKPDCLESIPLAFTMVRKVSTNFSYQARFLPLDHEGMRFNDLAAFKHDRGPVMQGVGELYPCRPSLWLSHLTSTTCSAESA